MKKMILVACALMLVLANNATALMTIESYTCFDNIAIQLSQNTFVSERSFSATSYYNGGQNFGENYAVSVGENGLGEAIASEEYVATNYGLKLQNEGVGLTAGLAEQNITIEGTGIVSVDLDYNAYISVLTDQTDAISTGVAEPYMRMEAYINGDPEYYYWFGIGMDWGSFGIDQPVSDFIWSQNGHRSMAISFDGTLNLLFHTGAYIEGVREYSQDPAPVPEPATVFLLGIGLAGFLGKSRFSIHKMKD